MQENTAATTITATTSAAVLGLSDFNLSAESEQAHEFEVISPKDGRATGFFISVLGEHSDTAKAFVRKELNARRRHQAIQMKKGKDIEVETIEDDESFVVESCVVRVVGWRGLKDSFTPDNARLLFKTNPEIRKQVLAASGDLANFTKV